jgi:SAM-dependent methyltransferase
MGRDWHRAYESGETPWDKGAPAPPLLAFLGRHRVAGSALVPGCGYGHDVRALAAQGAVVTGLDLAPGAVRGARAFPPSGNERYLEGDFLDLPEGLRGAFDWLVEHTLFCAIDPTDRPRYARSVRDALRPGGRFLGIFYRRIPRDDGRGPPYAVSGAELDRLFGPAFDLLEAWTPLEAYPSRPPGSEEVRLMGRRA